MTTHSSHHRRRLESSCLSQVSHELIIRRYTLTLDWKRIFSPHHHGFHITKLVGRLAFWDYKKRAMDIINLLPLPLPSQPNDELRFWIAQHDQLRLHAPTRPFRVDL